MAFADSLKWFLDWLPAILGCDLMTLYKLFFFKKPVKTPSGSVMMTDYELVRYHEEEGYTAHEKHITETPLPPDYKPISYTESTEMAAARKAEQARLAALSEPEKTAYYEQQTTIEQRHTEQQRQVFRTEGGTVTVQPLVTMRTVTTAPPSSPKPTPTSDSSTPPQIDSAYDAYENRRVNLE